MSRKRRGSELDHEAKKTKSDESNNDKEVPSSSWVQTTRALTRQPVTDLSDLPQATRRQFDYLIKVLSDISPETLYEVNILDQINAVKVDGLKSPPTFEYEPPDMRITLGSVKHIDVAHDCNEEDCDRITATVKAVRYGVGHFRVEVSDRKRHTGGRLVSPYPVTFEERHWKEDYALKVQSLARKAVVAHNREVLGWGVRNIVRSEDLDLQVRGREKARQEFLSGDVSWTEGSKLAVYFR